MANPYAPPSVDENPSVGERHDYRPTQALSLVVRVLLGVTTFITLLGIGQGYLRLDLFGRIQQGSNFTIAEAEASDVQVAMLAVLYLLVLLATAITWIVWQTRTSKNARALGAEYMEYGPNAWGWFFCPFINFFRPLAVVQELWWVNDPQSQREAPSYFWLWWIPWVVGSILGNVSARMATEDADVDQLILSTQLDMASGLFLIVAAIFAMKVVSEIHLREQARARSLGLG